MKANTVAHTKVNYDIIYIRYRKSKTQHMILQNVGKHSMIAGCWIN